MLSTLPHTLRAALGRARASSLPEQRSVVCAAAAAADTASPPPADVVHAPGDDAYEDDAEEAPTPIDAATGPLHASADVSKPLWDGVELTFTGLLCDTDRSQIWTGRHCRYGEVVIKPVPDNPVARQQHQQLMPREAVMMQQIGAHPNIVQLLVLIDAGLYWYLVMPRLNADGRTLLTLLVERNAGRPRGLRIDEWLPLYRQLLEALHFCHQRRICHHDLKLQNIVLCDSDSRVVLIDWEFSQRLYDPYGRPSLCHSHAGTLEFSPPEMFGQHPHDALASDVWSLGVCYYAARTGTLPFGTVASEAPAVVQQRILAGQWSISRGKTFTRLERNLLRRLFSPNSAARPPISELLADCNIVQPQ